MTKIPNTFRRGHIFWFRIARRLPSGNLFRPTVSLWAESGLAGMQPEIRECGLRIDQPLTANRDPGLVVGQRQ